MPTDLQHFCTVVYQGEVEPLRACLASAEDLDTFINQPLFSFGQTAVHMVKDNLPLLDVLLEFGADINQKSEWEPGPFHILEGTDPEIGGLLVERGATPDIFTYTSWDDQEAVLEVLREDPTQVHARGGDGVLPLHYAQSVAMATLLLDRGANIDARCVDHESTAAQYMVRQRPQVLDYLVEQGATIDIFLAIARDDRVTISARLKEEPDSIEWRIGEGRYDVPTKDPMGKKGGNIYLWRLGGGLSPIEVAAWCGQRDAYELLRPHASPRNRFAAAIRLGDVDTAKAEVAHDANLLENATPPLNTMLGDMVWNGKLESVEALLNCGVPVDTRWNHGHTPLIVAALRGYPQILQRLIEEGADLTAKNEFGGAAAQSLAFASVQTPAFCPNPDGDYLACAMKLVAAGATLGPEDTIGRPDVLACLRGNSAS